MEKAHLSYKNIQKWFKNKQFTYKNIKHHIWHLWWISDQNFFFCRGPSNEHSYQASFNKPQMSNFNSTFVELYKFLQKLYVFFFDVHVQEITFTIISQVSRNWS
jgi:hypothetical protein